MIKIKLYELDKHRNECTFRPFLYAQNSIRDIGIEFTTGDSYDFAWVAQASFLNKKVCLDQSVNDGLEFLSKISGDYMLIDGQDSTSLIGSYEVFKQSNALLLLKNSLLKDRSLYKNGSQLGRYYWGTGEYKLDDFDMYSDRIVLSGTNWLMTHWAGIQRNWYQTDKRYDISAMFQYPSKEVVYEYGYIQSIHYDMHRKPIIDVIQTLPYKIAKLINGERVSIDEYYNRIASSKILLAPYGYGEMAPRDIEAAMFGSILIKPDMSYIDTAPDIFENKVTYIACKHDFSDLEEKINLVLGNYDEFSYIISNARKRIEEAMMPDKLALHLYGIFKTLKQVTV
jgi:hypothetical protein